MKIVKFFLFCFLVVPVFSAIIVGCLHTPSNSPNPVNYRDEIFTAEAFVEKSLPRSDSDYQYPDPSEIKVQKNVDGSFAVSSSFIHHPLDSGEIKSWFQVILTEDPDGGVTLRSIQII